MATSRRPGDGKQTAPGLRGLMVRSHLQATAAVRREDGSNAPAYRGQSSRLGRTDRTRQWLQRPPIRTSAPEVLPMTTNAESRSEQGRRVPLPTTLALLGFLAVGAFFL